MEALQNGNYFISCDWGTSNLRLQLVNKDNLQVVAATSTDEGVVSVFKKWKETKDNRFQFFRSVIDKQLAALEAKSGTSLQTVPLVISGMASATMGMQEIPYKLMPFHIDGSDLEYRINGNAIIISGARTDNDVMRGEETQVVGIADQLEGDAFIILPGTHSKHVNIADKKAVSVQTFMTGELFQLLCDHSVISGSVTKSPDYAQYNDYFLKGVTHGLENNFLNSIFSARTNMLLNKLSPEQNYFFLSGVTIGEELKIVRADEIYLIGNQVLNQLYSMALKLINEKTRISCIPADTATILGHSKVLQYVKYLFD